MPTGVRAVHHALDIEYHLGPAMNSIHHTPVSTQPRKRIHCMIHHRCSAAVLTQAFEGVISSLGKSRDLDGSVDRVAAPPNLLVPILFALKQRCYHENVEIAAIFEEWAGPPCQPGLLPLSKFESALKSAFPRYHITEDTFSRIRDHYGVGYQASTAPTPHVAQHQLLLQHRMACT